MAEELVIKKEMMKRILLTLILLGCYLQLLSQQCVNEVSTHPDNEPTQNHLNALPRDPLNSSSSHDEPPLVRDFISSAGNQ
jgi:hypothetical protein